MNVRRHAFTLLQELTAQHAMVVSGHHRKLHFESNRLIIDESGGFDDWPIAAMILPARELVRDTDNLQVSEILQKALSQPVVVPR